MQLKRFSKYIFLGLNGAAKPSAVLPLPEDANVSIL